MQTISLQPQRSRLNSMTFGIICLCMLAFAVPQAAIAASACLPLCCCPLQGKRVQWIAWASVPIPCLACLLAGMDPWWSLSLTLPVLLPMLITLIPAKTRRGAHGIVLYVSASAVSLALCCIALTHGSFGVSEFLSASAEDAVLHSSNPGMLLYRLSGYGLLSLSKGQLTILRLVSLKSTSPQIQEMAFSFKYTLNRILSQLIPGLFIETILIIGLFTALRVEKINGTMLIMSETKPTGKKVGVLMPAGFRHLTIPLQLRTAIVLCALIRLITLGSEMPWLNTLGQLCIAFDLCLLRMEGCAVILYIASDKRPDSIGTAGIGCAILYLLIPAILGLIGFGDLLLNFRKRMMIENRP